MLSTIITLLVMVIILTTLNAIYHHRKFRKHKESYNKALEEAKGFKQFCDVENVTRIEKGLKPILSKREIRKFTDDIFEYHVNNNKDQAQ